MTTMSKVPDEHPLMIAWNEYKAGPDFENTKQWATAPKHTEGSLWAAFMAGWYKAVALQAQPAEARGGGKVVAWMTPGGDVSRSFYWCLERCLPGQKPQPLYAAPPSAHVGVEGLASWMINNLLTESQLSVVPPGQRKALRYLAQQPEAQADGCHCATCTCKPGMTPAVRFDTSPVEREGAVRYHLIRMGWTPPQQPAAVGEEIMVNAAHDVYILPLQPSGLLSGPRFVVHVPGPEKPAAVDDLNAWRAAFVAERAMRYREGGMKIEQARIHAETDAARMAVAAAAQQPAPEEG